MTNVPRLVLAALVPAVLFAVLPAGGALTGPVYPPPLGVSFSQSGSQGDTQIGRSSGKTWYISNVQLASATDVYWGAENSGVALSMRQQPFQSYEYCTYRPDLSNLPGGIAVWTGATYVPVGTWVATKFTLTVRDGSSNPVPLSNAAALGLSGNLGGLVKVTPGLSFSANLKFEATYSSSNTGWTPALDLFDASCVAYSTSGATYSSFQAGFYYRETMGVQPSSLAFTGQVYSVIAPQTLTITNSSFASKDYAVTSDSFWLSADTTAGTLAAGAVTTVVARVATRGLAPRTYAGRLTVSAADGSNAPQEVPVSLSLSAVSPPSRVLAWGHNGNGQANVPANVTNAVAVAAGTYHSLALRANGTLTAWGSNGYGESSIHGGLPSVTAVAAGYCDTLVLFATGSLYAWGCDGYGAISGQPSGINNAVAVAAGEYHLLALRADGTVAAWGWNDYGQTTVTPGLSNAVAVSGGYLHSMALRANGTVTVWGFNSDGQLNVPAGLTNAVAVAAGKFHSLALKADGTVAAWGSGAYGASTVPPGLSNVVSIAAGWNSSQALREDGTVVAWGCNDYGQRNVPPELTNAVAVASGYYHSLALAPANALAVSSPYGSPSPARGTNWVIRGARQTCSVNALVMVEDVPYRCTGWTGSGSVPASGTTNSLSFVMTNDSSITWQWASVPVISMPPASLAFTGMVYSAIVPQTFAFTNTGAAPLTYSIASDSFWLSADASSGTLAPGAGTTVVVRVATRGLAPRTYGGRLVLSCSDAMNSPQAVPVTLALRAVSPPSIVLARGGNGYGQLNVPAGLNDVVAVAGGYFHSLVLRADGTVASWGFNNAGQSSPQVQLTNAVSVAAGFWHSLAVRADGTVAAWGYNAYGQTSMPAGLTNVVAVAGGGAVSLALRTDGAVIAWGSNNDGMLNVPADLTNAVAIAAGGYHELALRADGTVAGWGNNGFGQASAPGGLTDVVAVAAGAYHSLALRADGTVFAWGQNWYGQVNVPGGLTDVVAVAAGWSHSLALRANGTVVAWGDNSAGQTSIPTGLPPAMSIAGGGDHSLILAPASSLEVFSSLGSPVPVRGTNWLIRNTWQALSVEAQVTSGNMQYVCTGWVGSGSVPSSGTSNYVSVLLDSNSSIAWLWQTNYAIAVSAGDHGSIAPSGTVYVPCGSDQAFMITPEAYYHIEQVRTDGVLAGANLGESPYPFTLHDIADTGTLHVTFAENLAPLGTPEHWLARYGTTTGGVTFAQAETNNHDGDPFDTWQEYVADTDPTNSASYFYIEGISNAAGRAVFFLSSPNRIYTLNAKTNLLQELWQPVPERANISGNGGRLTLTDPETTATSIFYRVRVQLP